ncbi:hypothetical protein [Melissococcus plutonius]|uniref:hypothetical protein n=1 Tax=Melissococcus plutonius TaxID=33970 RepID=UPI0021E5A85E|nr:hypothetical protein [Melissococcus plutonius]MCV2498195.1 hypothetical protein [Melissococcus plutonius]MCV2501903.1 hypothetical protein [Melissococcus plutonius]MCV2506810.1 hypothetical protein [Melissococcus plutonius]MCV2527146.1 hypothetical protein [Melissococcus plutonius]
MSIFKRFISIENSIFALFIVAVLYGALKSPYSILAVYSENPWVLLEFLLSFVLFIIIIYLNKRKISLLIQPYWMFIKKHDLFFLSSSLLVLFMLQVGLLIKITTPIGWDVFDIFHSITTENKEYSKIVLSLNPNNTFFFFMMYFINKFLHFIDVTGSWSNTWLSWQIVNCLFIDISLFLFYQAAKRVFNKVVASIAYSLFFLSLGLSPWLLVPYTDTAVLLFISLILFTYSIFDHVKSSIGKAILLLIIGMELASCFLMKPSSIVFFLAFLCIKTLKLMLVEHNKQALKIIIVISLFLCIGVSYTVKSFRYFVNKQTITEIDKQQAKPWTLFVMMGLTGTGGYNDVDTKAVNQLPTQEEKKAYTIKIIQERLKDKGFFGYLHFLAKKNIHNTANGDFDWGWDGGKLTAETPARTPIQKRLQNLYYPQNPKSKSIRIYMHSFYLLTLLGLLFSVPLKDRENKITILKLAFIGAILYLLFFEGGRSRYLIQFMPFWYLLSSNGWLRLWNYAKK